MRDEQLSIGEFAARSRLSAKALRLYDELGLLAPARVDEGSGYRYYDVAQLEVARLIAALRGLQMPLAEIKAIVAVPGADPGVAAERIRAFWAATEAQHDARRRLAAQLIDQLNGTRSVMYEVDTREIPERSLLCLKRNVAGEPAAWALGKEFIALMREHQFPRLEGRTGAVFSIYWGEVNDDSDGPVEWCRPVPADQAATLTAQCPDLTLRTEPAHHEAFVNIGVQPGPVEWQVVSRTLHDWGEERSLRPTELGVRVTYLASEPVGEQSGPDCDFAVPFSR